MCDVLAWIENHQGLAAWVEGIATIAAVGVAIYVPSSQRRAEDDRIKIDREIQADSMAVLIYPGLLEVKAKIQGARNSNFPNEWGIKLPDEWHNFVDKAFIMGEKAAHAFLQLNSIVFQLNRMVKELNEDDFVSKDKSQLSGHYDTLEKLVSEAIDEIGKIHDRAVPPKS